MGCPHASCGEMGRRQHFQNTQDDFQKHKGRHDYYLQWMVKCLTPLDSCCEPATLTRTSKLKRQRPAQSNVHDLLSRLKSCSRKRDLHEGRRLHKNAVETGNESDMFVSAALVHMYSKCGSMIDAQRVFDSIKERDVVSWNALILGYADNGNGQAALSVFSRMKSSGGCAPDSLTYVAAIKGCTSLAVDESGKRECLKRGTEICMEIGQHHMNHFVQNSLINMCAKSGSMVKAQQVFDSMEKADAVSWNALILGYAENGDSRAAIDCFCRMKSQCAPDSVTYLVVIKACTTLAADEATKVECLKWGRQIQMVIGHGMNRVMQNTLINLYVKCGSMADARQVFDTIEEPDVVSWTTLIMGYANNGEGQTALDFFSKMKTIRRCALDSVTYVAAIKACIGMAVDETRKAESLKRGKEIHKEIGHHMNQFLQNTLITMYARCGSMADARRVFDCIEQPNVVVWNTLIHGYAENKEGQVALDVFSEMKTARLCATNSGTYVAAIKACTTLAAGESLKRGGEIHMEIGQHMNYSVQTTLINMYTKCSSMKDAQRVFDSMKDPEIVSWTALILGYAENGEGQAALNLFSRLKAAHQYTPDSVLYAAVIKACTSLAAAENGKEECLKWGREIHSEIGHVDMDHFLQSTLINMYAKSGSMSDAQHVFDSIKKPDVVSWNALIMGYADNGEGQTALNFFSRMKFTGDCSPDAVTYVSAIKACTSMAVDGAGKEECLKQGKEIHLQIGHHMYHFLQSTLINMYAKCGSMVDAQRVFDSIKEPDLVSWTTLIQGYADNGEGQAALEFFSRMKARHECAPDSVTYIAAFKACASIGALATGRKFHSEVTDFIGNVVTCLVDFYAKCGSMAEAREVFDTHSATRNIETWTALLAGYSRFGDSGSVFEVFDAMQNQGIRPDAVTFLSILLCCSHAGLVEKAREYLQAMHVQYGITPTLMHYSCMIDVLGRANKFDEAVALLQKMPCNPDAVTWMTLLGACRKWKNVEIGRLAFQSLGEKSASAYVLMAEIYSSRCMWEERERVLETSRQLGVRSIKLEEYSLSREYSIIV